MKQNCFDKWIEHASDKKLVYELSVVRDKYRYVITCN